MRDPIRIEEQLVIGSNGHGYTFAVGRVGDRWLGYAIGAGILFVFPGVSEGCEMGLADRDEAIRRVYATACDPGGGYGGIDPWTCTLPPELRADPDAYRCEVCGEVCCESGHADDDGREG